MQHAKLINFAMDMAFFRQSVYTGNIAFWNWSPENTNKTMFVLNSVNLQ